jgi:hypothetical protein
VAGWQIFHLSSLLELDHGQAINCGDLISWLPHELALKIFSYLDPRALCRAAQVQTRQTDTHTWPESPARIPPRNTHTHTHARADATPMQGHAPAGR